MELSRQDYPAVLDSLQPAQAVYTFNDRVKRVTKLNIEIADWLQERRKVEEAYAQGLRKLALRRPPDESSELGVFSVPWMKIINSTETIASSHHLLAQKIEVDVERPLRTYNGENRDMQAMSNIQGNLTAMAKEIDSAQDKSEKLKRRGGKASASKVAAVTTDMENATSQWQSQAPYIFEKLQALDESRLNHLRDVLTQFQTHEVDQVERSRITAEETLNTILNIETVDEIKTFAARTVSGKPRLERPRSRTIGGSSSARSISHPPMEQDTNSSPIEPDAASQRSGASGGGGGGRGSTLKESRSGGLGSSLKSRLGTVMSRGKRNSVLPDQRSPSPGKHSSERFSPFSRGSRDVPPIPSPRNSTPNLATSPGTEDAGRKYRNVDASSPLDVRTRSQENVNGENTAPVPGMVNAFPLINGPSSTEASNLSSTQLSPPITVTRDGQRDDEGFSVPPPPSDAISQAQQEAASMDESQQQFKLDIRQQPIQEEENDAETALAHVANTLRAQAAPPSRKAGTVRGRREARNTVLFPSAPSPDLTGGESPSNNSPLRTVRAAALTTDDHTGSDTQSIRSSRSLSTISSAVVKHPDMHEPGLNSSVVETVSSWFEAGKLTKAVVIGELALVYNPANLSSPLGTETIRLDKFAALEKVAPNPTFISQQFEKSGEYGVNLSQLSKTQVAFKYQLQLDEASIGSQAPLIISPAWKIEPTQTSVILNYSLNTLFGATAGQAVSLHEVTIVIHLEGTKASVCQSKPVGTFSKEKSIVYWRLDDITLTASDPPTKLLARFTTEREAKAGPVEARWEIIGENAKGVGSGVNVSQMTTVSGTSSTAVAVDADPFADERAVPSPSIAWKEAPSVRRLVSGKYIAS